MSGGIATEGATPTAPPPVGYLHPLYADSLSEFGAPRPLPASGGWVLERGIPGSGGARDAMGCYPLFSCRDWSRLRLDLDDLEGKLVSVALVADPFGAHDAELLRDCFRDAVVPFKEHYVVDLGRDVEEFAHPHHRRNARRALREVSVEECADPPQLLDDWAALYGTLVERHGVRGIAAFSRASFAKQLRVPGCVAFRAVLKGETVGMLLWYVQGGVAYYHLGAYSERGYEARASFALFRRAVDEFARRGLRWLNLGGGAGAGDASSGLSRFKQGWATGTRTAYFCGRVLDRGGYERIVAAKGAVPTHYFPAYRLGEFS
jgi:hypothetical protein